jgi:hypothetical protein
VFERLSATADHPHRAFFDRAGEVRQVWARQAAGALFYLADGGVDDQVRAAAHAGRLTCPYPGCPDPRFIAKGGSERRHHFAHQVAGQEHRTTAAWRHQALLMLADWVLAVNPQERLIATIAETQIAQAAWLIRSRTPEAMLCIVDTLEHARLAEDGIHTPASDSIDEELERRRAAEEQARARCNLRPRRRPAVHARPSSSAGEPILRPSCVSILPAPPPG